jgi:tetratricopeptide (TPR) repeat protein
VDVEFDNIRQAMNWALNGPALVRAVQALNTLGWYWLMRCSWDEGYTWMEQALKRLDSDHPTVERAGLLRELGMVSIVRPFSTNARQYLDESRELFRALGDWCGYAAATRWLAVTFYGVDWKSCFDYYLESAHIFRQLGDDLNLAISWWMLGHNLRDSGDLEQGEYYLRECERLFRDLGSWMVGNSDFNLARIYDLKGQVPEARRLYAQALPSLQAVNDHWGIMFLKIFLGEMELKAASNHTGLLLARRLLLESLENSQKLGRAYGHNFATPILLAKAESRLGEPAGAIHWYREALSILREFYLDRSGWELCACGKCLYGLAELFVSQHRPVYSARLLGGLDGLRELKTRLWDDISADDFERLAQAVRVIAGEGDFSREFEAGKGMTLKQAVDYALQETDDEYSPNR